MNEVAAGRKLGYKWMLGLNITAYLNWLIASFAGGLLGQWIPDPEVLGLDFALPAMFIGLLVLQMTSRRQLRTDLLVALSAVVIVIALSYVVSGSVGIIIAAVLASLVGVMIDKWK